MSVDRQSGPFSNDGGSYRGGVAGQADPGATVTATHNGQLFAQGNVVIAADGSFTVRPIRLLPDGTPATMVFTATTFDGFAAKTITLSVQD